MGLSRRGARTEAPTWPGFVDALTTLLLVLMFVLSIFVVTQAVLRDTITTQDTELDALNAQVAGLADALGLERNRAKGLEDELGQLTASLTALQAENAAQAGQIADFTAQVASLLGERDAARGQVSELRGQLATGAAEAAALRDKISASDARLIALTLDLETQRKKAEETLVLLAAAQAAAEQAKTENLKVLDEKDLALAMAQTKLTEEQKKAVEQAAQLALLNEQIAALRGQLGALQGLLDAAAEKDAVAKVQIEALGSSLNSALAQVASEQRRRAELEEAERKRLEAEAKNLEKFRSEFFGQLREVLGNRPGVRIVGDRFVFSSEVLFTPGSATLAPEGRAQIAGVVQTLNGAIADIPPGLNWIIRVDGHTDNVPLSGGGAFRDNWELSQARALSVVRYMQDELGFPPDRLAATGFGEWQPVVAGETPEARAQNRRIELKLTER
ncbi:peptidoglycan -binding protein [Neogemmobacter tilapiae]|uniref:Flagellar motor protein n=1 Tax=Neogemmobacter tilapiae TaxID=875041 RepID=A0A918U1E3_9RHOB|nr:peptidoglycan -binding protein [Gemmobacter tilapiae]GHC65994.1 flagellar motor protein [Gemmobacter tilapiae]